MSTELIKAELLMQMNFYINYQSFPKIVKDKNCCFGREVKKINVLTFSLYCIDDDVVHVLVLGQNGIRTKWYTDKMVYGQNVTDKSSINPTPIDSIIFFINPA